MSHSESDSPKGHRGAAQFAPTHWSVVLAAARTASPEADAAMESLCKAYWFPSYAYLRRRGLARAEAEDLTQEFFSRRITNGRILRGLDPAAGKFRTWLLNSLQNLMHNEWDRQQAQKRGGGAAHLPLDLEGAERNYGAQLRDDVTPEKLYDVAWAAALLKRVLKQLEARWTQQGKGRDFRELKCFLPGAYSQQPYADVASRLGKTENAVKTAVSRLRQEYGELLRAEVGQTVSNEAEAQEELRYLMTVVGS